VESLDKPLRDKLLHAMAQAYPDPLDLGLLAMVLGCDKPSLEAEVESLVREGLALARDAGPAVEPRWQAPFISDKGMAIADGLATSAEDATALLDHLEAAALRQLLVQRILGSHLPRQQMAELCSSLDAVRDAPLMDAARVWAHQTVGDWCGLLKVMTSGLDAPMAGAAAKN